MAFPVNFSNANLLKRVNLLRSKGDFSGKSGRIARNSIQTDVERPTDPRVVDGWLQTGRNLAPVCGVLQVFARIADRYANSENSQHGRTSSSTVKEMPRLSTKKYAGAQCKKTDELTITVIEAEVAEAEKFVPTLTEYVLMTTAPRDAAVQKEVRTHSWPFDRVQVMFWEDISLELSGHDDLLQKHFPGWMRKTTTEEQVLNLIMSSSPMDFTYDDGTGTFFRKQDVQLKIIYDRMRWCRFRGPRGLLV